MIAKIKKNKINVAWSKVSKDVRALGELKNLLFTTSSIWAMKRFVCNPCCRQTCVYVVNAEGSVHVPLHTQVSSLLYHLSVLQKLVISC